mgnify:CR=1 FL=1
MILVLPPRLVPVLVLMLLLRVIPTLPFLLPPLLLEVVLVLLQLQQGQAPQG